MDELETEKNKNHVLGLVDKLSYRDNDLQNYLKNICKGLIELMGDGLAAITLYQNNQKHVLMIVPGYIDPDRGMNVKNHHSTYVVQTGMPLTIYDCQKVTEFGSMLEDYRGYLGVPLINVTGLALGTLCYYVKKPRHFSEDEYQVSKTLAERAAIAIDNYRLYKKISLENQSLERVVEEKGKELSKVQSEIIHKSKLAEIGEFATKITHEMRSPLSTIGLTLDCLKLIDLPKNAAARLELAHSEVNRMERLLSEILVCAKPVSLYISEIDIENLLLSSLTSIKHLTKSKNQHFDIVTQSKGIQFGADRDKLIQIFVNLATNACEAAPTDSIITWNIGENIQNVFISVHNLGKPISSEYLPKITESFFTTKPNGTGLGLTVVRSLVEAHNGFLDVVSDAEQGTTFTICLPKKIN